VLTGTGTNTSTWTATATTTNTALGSLTGISSTVTNTNTATDYVRAPAPLTTGALPIATSGQTLGDSHIAEDSDGIETTLGLRVKAQASDHHPWAGTGLELTYSGDDEGMILSLDRSSGLYKKLSIQGSMLWLGSKGTVILDPDGNTSGVASGNLIKPAAGSAGFVLGTTDGSSTNIQWVQNGTGSGIGCSGANCTYGNWARFTDTTHIEGVAAPTWSSVGADQAGAAAAVQGLLGIQLVDVQSAMRGTSYTSSASYEYSTISSVGFTALGGQRIIVHGVASAATYTTNGSCTLAIFLGSSQIGPTINSNTNNHRTTLSTVVNYPGLSAGSYTVYLKMSTGEEGSTCAIDANASYLMVERYTN
jgi:hypothetical protein